MREQLWILPGADPRFPLRATVFRPDDNVVAGASLETAPQRLGRRPMIVINHGTSEPTRQSVAMPIYYWLSRWFVERGYVVVLPQRRGHGATGGPLAESRGDCTAPDHYASGQIAADDLQAAIAFMSQEAFVEPGETIVAGVSTGGWATLALSSRPNAAIRGVINIAGGRGGHAWGERSKVCAPERLIEAAGRYARTATVPGLWLYARNDSYFGPALAEAMKEAWTNNGGRAELHILPAYGSEGHDIADDAAGWSIWGPAVDRFLGQLLSAPNTGSRVSDAGSMTVEGPAMLPAASR